MFMRGYLVTRTYIEIPKDDVTDLMIEQCIQTSRDTLVECHGGLCYILKWEDATPSSIQEYLDANPGLPTFTREEWLFLQRGE